MKRIATQQSSSLNAASKACATSHTPAWRPACRSEPDAVSINVQFASELGNEDGGELLFWQCIRSRFDFGQGRQTLNLAFQQVQSNKLE
jgi:hypothetical protein